MSNSGESGCEGCPFFAIAELLLEIRHLGPRGGCRVQSKVCHIAIAKHAELTAKVIVPEVLSHP